MTNLLSTVTKRYHGTFIGYFWLAFHSLACSKMQYSRYASSLSNHSFFQIPYCSSYAPILPVIYLQGFHLLTPYITCLLHPTINISPFCPSFHFTQACRRLNASNTPQQSPASQPAQSTAPFAPAPPSSSPSSQVPNASPSAQPSGPRAPPSSTTPAC